ncbi:hypothetical protein HMPREF1486_00093 [Streptomyces sp. HPH0547]|nr:hypothetical protein HMPREF1486_00093 [Streptomyces sp. HPH0547]
MTGSGAARACRPSPAPANWTLGAALPVSAPLFPVRTGRPPSPPAYAPGAKGA